jgi:single-strand DNA-binding protein
LVRGGDVYSRSAPYTTAMYLNKVMIIGNLTRDPELKSLPSGVKVTSFSLATNRSWKDQNGAKQEATEFHNAVAFAKPAELIAQYCKKGSSLYIDGRLQTRSWGKDGEKKYRTEIVVENFQFGPRASGAPGGASDTPRNDKPAKDESDVDTIEYPADDINAEDIPF